jgi:hypothetical protein
LLIIIDAVESEHDTMNKRKNSPQIAEFLVACTNPVCFPMSHLSNRIWAKGLSAQYCRTVLKKGRISSGGISDS